MIALLTGVGAGQCGQLGALPSGLPRHTCQSMYDCCVSVPGLRLRAMSSGGGLVDHAFAAQYRDNLVLTSGAPSQPAVESVGPDSASLGSHAPCTMQANRPERKKGRVRLLRVPDEQRQDGLRHLPACLAGFRRSRTWQRVCCAILQGCPLLRLLLLRGW